MRLFRVQTLVSETSWLERSGKKALLGVSYEGRCHKHAERR